MQYIQNDVKLYTLSSARGIDCPRALERRDRPSSRAVPSQLLRNRGRRALVGLATTDSVPDSSESDTSHEHNRGVVHGVESDGERGGHGEERDGEADPS